MSDIFMALLLFGTVIISTIGIVVCRSLYVEIKSDLLNRTFDKYFEKEVDKNEIDI